MTSPNALAHVMRRELVGRQFAKAPYQWGVVNAVTASAHTVDLYLDGSATITPAVRHLDSYAPTVGDTVVVGRYGPDRFVLGRLDDGTTGINFLLNPPLLVAYQATTQNVVASTVTVLKLDTVVIDSYSAWTTGASNKFTAPVAGYYDINVRAGIAAISSGFLHAYIQVNGTSTTSLVVGAASISVHDCIELAVDDYVQFAVYQSSGSTQATSVDLRECGMTIRWVHA